MSTDVVYKVKPHLLTLQKSIKTANVIREKDLIKN